MRQRSNTVPRPDGPVKKCRHCLRDGHTRATCPQRDVPHDLLLDERRDEWRREASAGADISRILLCVEDRDRWVVVLTRALEDAILRADADAEARRRDETLARASRALAAAKPGGIVVETRPGRRRGGAAN